MSSTNEKEYLMSTLGTLKLTAAKRSLVISPLMQRRNKLLKKIFDQIELAKAMASGGTYAPTRFRTVRDEHGLSRSIEVPRRVRPWWFPTDAGKIAVSIRYGTRVVEISKGKSAIEVATGDELLKALSLVAKAVEAGELDAQIESASNKLKEGFGK